MAIPKIVGAQRDFSAGELDVTMKRADDHPMMKAGARQMLNWRILQSRNVQQRPGRSALFLETGRVEKVTMSPGNTFYLAFNPAGILRVYSLAGVQLFSAGGLPWSSSTLQNIRRDIFRLQIFIGFPGMQPRVLTWDGVSTWTLTNFAETISVSGQKRTFFYRISPQNVTMKPSATIGNVTLIFSSAICVAGMVGTRMRYANRQVLITAFTSTTQLSALVIEPLPPSQTLTLASSQGNFAIGDVVRGSATGAQGIVISAPTTQVFLTSITSGQFNVGDSITGGTSGATGIITSLQPWQGLASVLYTVVSLSTGTAFVNSETITSGAGATGTTSGASTTGMVVQLLAISTNLNFFTASDTVVGPSGSGTTNAISTGAPQAIGVWDDEVMNAFRGWPSSVFVDQFRLGFCNFPALPNAVGYSAINSPGDMYVDGTPSGAIFSLAPSKSQIFDVVPGPESGEFVFCDNRIFYIPITTANPLVSGNVDFNLLSSDGAANVQPRASEELIFYVAGGGLRVKCVIAPGAYFRPFNTVDVSENHTHLFKTIIALATPSTDSNFPERYCYAMNSDGSIAVGKYSSKQGQVEGVVGWLPWSGGGSVQWVSATVGSDVIFTTTYFATSIVEKLDATQYLDGAVSVNNLPPALAAPAGQGPLWFIAGQTVTLMDLGTRAMGTYNIDAKGNIIPQFIGGENLASAQLIAGQPWISTLEPFVPDANPGNSVHQRMFKRRVSRMAVYVSNSTGFLLARLFSGPLTRTSPALGTIMNTYRVTAYNQDDDATQPPPLREEAQRWRPLGRAFDPRVAAIKDTPGPLTIHEFGIESSV